MLGTLTRILMATLLKRMAFHFSTEGAYPVENSVNYQYSSLLPQMQGAAIPP